MLNLKPFSFKKDIQIQKMFNILKKSKNVWNLKEMKKCPQLRKFKNSSHSKNV
jgi:hypothetical protein